MTYDDIVKALPCLNRPRLRRLAFEALMLADGPDRDTRRDMSDTQATKQSEVRVPGYAPAGRGWLGFRVYGKVTPDKELFSPFVPKPRDGNE